MVPPTGNLKRSKINISVSVLKKAYEFAVKNGENINGDNVITLHIAEDNAMGYFSISKMHTDKSEAIDITNYDLF